MSTQTRDVPVTPKTLGMLYGTTFNVLKQNLADIDHEESLKSPQPHGNCANWILGHILSTRNSILRMLGQEPVWGPDYESPYDRGAGPLVDAARARNFEEMLELLEISQERIMTGISALTSEFLTASVPEGKNFLKLDSNGEVLAAFNFHEAYHTGQTGLVRRTIGKDGVIN